MAVNPVNPTATRNSDRQIKVTWQNGGPPHPNWTFNYASISRETNFPGSVPPTGYSTYLGKLPDNSTSYTDNGISPDSKYAYTFEIWWLESGMNRGMTQWTNVVYTTPAAPSSVKATRPSNDYIAVDITGPARWATSYEIQRSTDSGKSWAAAGSTASFPWNDTSAPDGAVMYRVRATVSGLYSSWTQSNELVVGPPLAPTVTGIPNVVPTGTVITFSWTPNHPDGSPQTQAQVEFVFNGETHTYDISGDATTYSFDSGEQTGDLTVRVRTHGIDDEWGAWSQYYACGIYYPPSVLVTDPASDTSTVGYVPYVFKWNAVDDTGISSQKLEIFRDGQAVFSKTLDGAARELSIGLSDLPFENGAAYSVTVTASGGSGLSSSYTRRFSVEWIAPSVPEADVATDEASLSCFVTVHAGASEGEEADIAEVPAGKTVNGVTVYGSTRQNLWSNPYGLAHGVTITKNDDGSITLSGTPTATSSTNLNVGNVYTLRPGGTYTLSLAGGTFDDGLRNIFVREFRSDGTQDAFGLQDGRTTLTFTVNSTTEYVSCYIGYTEGVPVSGTYRIMLNEGDTAEPWCPPGLNGVEELSVVCAGKNLASTEFNDAVSSGITFNTESDGSISVVGTATSTYPQKVKVMNLPSNTDMVVSKEVTGDVGSGGYCYVIIYGIRGSEPEAIVSTRNADEAAFNTGEYDYWNFIVVAEGNGVAFDCKLYPQIELGSTATAYEPPSITTTPIDLDGHALNSLPDGTRDELTVDASGNVTLVKRVGSLTVPSGATLTYVDESSGHRFNATVTSAGGRSDYKNSYCDKLPCVGSDLENGDALSILHSVQPNRVSFFASKTAFDSSDAAEEIIESVLPARLIYPLATPQEIELPPARVSASGPGVVFASSPVPATVKPEYMVGEEFTVARVIDGTEYVLEEGLTDGQQAIDRLPPLNVEFSYAVYAFASSGVYSRLYVPYKVDSGGMEAFNFGQDAGTAIVLGLDANGSESTGHSGEEYRFAMGPDTPMLPTFYPDGEISVSGTHSYIADYSQYKGIRGIARDRRNAVLWFRSALGDRARCAASWKLGYDAKRYRLLEVSVDLTEVVWEDPSNG